MRDCLTLCLLLAPLTVAAPAVTASDYAALEERQILSGVLKGALEGVGDALASGNTIGVKDLLAQTSLGKKPGSVAEAASRLQNIVQNEKPPNIYEYTVRLAVEGLLADPLTSLITGVGGQFTDKNSISNKNEPPLDRIYPKKSPCDSPYTVPEESLRAAIYIPPTFTCGKKPPVILFPGTGNTGYQTFAGNFIKLLTNVEWADPVWVNVPHGLVDDAQKSAQYAAYAMNYIASITKRKVAVTAWSQGNIDVQWAFKYYPSTRSVTTDHVAVSADYKGTVLANFVCPDGLYGCTPAVLQQQFLGASKFITALRSNGGDSAYVPTTSIYSGFFDEIVEPQQGDGASAFILDARGVGVTNVEVQTACAGALGGSFYTHEGLLYNPLPVALLKDAMAHDGPASLARIDSRSLCASYLAPGLNLGDLLVTENSVAIAGLEILLGQPRTLVEPPLLPFAGSAPSPTCRAGGIGSYISQGLGS